MEKPGAPEAPRSFASPQEELAYLRAELARRAEGQPKRSPEKVAREIIAEHKASLPEAVQAQATVEGEVVLKLSPEAHDGKMGELIHLIGERGVWYAMAAVEATQNAHLVDDFHRVLAEYVKEGYEAPGLAKRKELAGALSLVLYEVTLPQERADEKEERETLKELISSMEQFYQGLFALSQKKRRPFAVEIARPNGSSEVSFFIAVPAEGAELFEKQLLGVFPKARLEVRPDDYNIFPEDGFVSASQGAQKSRPIYSLKVYEEFDYDPLNILLNSFSKLDALSEGASVQFVMAPHEGKTMSRFQRALNRIREGVSIDKATDVPVRGSFGHGVKEFFFPAKKNREAAERRESDLRVKNIEKKVRSPLLWSNIRLVAAGRSRERSAAILRDLEAAFNQFSDTSGNAITFKLVAGRRMKDFVRSYSFRLFDERSALTLSTAEATTMAHLPPVGVRTAPEFKQSKAATAPAPANLPQEGLLLGVNRVRNEERKVYMLPEDRLRHVYVIGQTGTGKSVLLKNMIIQDIRAGNGVCFIDPHGVDVLDVLSAIPPERHQDVIYFDPGATERPFGLNMLEYDPRYPEQKTLVVDELFGIFRKLFGAVPESMGPAFEQYFRQSALLVMEDPESGNTLLDIARVFADPAFRALKLSRCKNPIVVQFWRGIAEQATGDMGLQNYAPYITNKFDIFTTNEIMRPIIAQQRSSFNFRDIMDTRKILLVNLAKGRVGDINANLLGLVLVGKFLIAALSRVDSVGKDLPPYYLYVDEFQNFTTDSIATILSEARKYKLSLTVAHQFIAQLEEKIRDAVFGNVGTLVSFRVGPEDAETLGKQFAPTFGPEDIMNVDNYNAYIRLLSRGRPEKPFSLATLPFTPGALENIDKLKSSSYLKYGRERQSVEAGIAETYRKKSPQSPEVLQRTSL